MQTHTIEFPDEINVSRTQFRLTMSFSACAALFSDHVSNILNLSSKPQMTWINALRVISSWAIVQNAQSVRNVAICDNPRCYCGKDNPFVSASDSNMTPIMGIFGASPEPASVRFADMSPESFLKGFGLAKLYKFLACAVRGVVRGMKCCNVGLHGKNRYYAKPWDISVSPGHSFVT